MKQIGIIICVAILFPFCSPKQNDVERIIENGVEVVINQANPHKIEGEPSSLHLDEIFAIDTEDDEIAKLGLTDIQGFDVDSEGNIYFFKPTLGKGDLIYKFDTSGKFLKSFGRKGQGPGEIQYALYKKITAQDEIFVVDTSGQKLIYYDQNGNLIKEIRYKDILVAQGAIFPLENGCLLIRYIEANYCRMVGQVSESGTDFVLALYDANFKWLKNLDRLHISSRLEAMKSIHMMPVYFWEVSGDKIYVGNSIRGYEIRIFDLNGTLLRKIRKNDKRVKFPDEIIDEFKNMTSNPASRLYGLRRSFPKYQPAFQRLCFIDDKERIYVMTFEKNNKSKGYMFDIFNPDGVLIERIALEVYVERFTGNFPLYAAAKNSNIYCLREKESGFKELTVFKMNWE